MQVRAYNYWASLLGDRELPRMEEIVAAELPGFAENTVVLDFSNGAADPAVAMLGAKLANECGVDRCIQQLGDVPGRSLLSRITDHCRQILAHAAPVGFAAEFVNQRGKTLLYRGILLPFSSDGKNVQHIMGVINWKELADPAVIAELRRELEVADRAQQAPLPGPRLAAWADGPAAAAAEEPGAALPTPCESRDLADRLALAREAAGLASAQEEHSRAQLYAAIGRAWDFALAAQTHPAALRDLAAGAGLIGHQPATMLPVVKLVFGPACDRTRLAKFATALAHARRHGVQYGQLASLLAAMPGGLEGMVREERKLRHAERTGKGKC